ncbi:unnamed protein product [Protopolystoma xenopodis]|uniref:Uncharacterized protein n=1 Tax=Protopolystoma xenopodis TaxID=117903 RepID=A0A3S5B3L6_9PLAT|nr:unnamed protein product [Protopolystoma xenopodis]
MLFEQTVDAYLRSHVASQEDFKCILGITPNFRDGLLIGLPSSLTAMPPKLNWFIRNGHHSSLPTAPSSLFIHRDPFSAS